MAVVKLTPNELQQMRNVGKLAADTLVMVSHHLRPGMTTDEIDRLVYDYTVERGARPAPLNYKGFPKSVCTSVNEVVCHGIPGARVLEDGDILNVDVTSVLPARNGFHGDTNATFYIGTPSPEARHVVEVARQCLEIGIQEVRPGARLGDIGAAIQAFAEAEGCSVVRDYCGHGIGRVFHAEPSVPHYGRPGTGIRLRRGMAFTIEPMINLGGWGVKHLDDGWTVLTADGSLSAQFEHTIVVGKKGAEVMTRRSAPLKSSEDVPWARLGAASCYMPSAAK
jgi:methionyl aminopeptidase